MIAIVKFSRYGQSYNLTFTPQQAKKELIITGYPGAKKLTDKECLIAIHEIFQY